jgi:hypothetical protein
MMNTKGVSASLGHLWACRMECRRLRCDQMHPFCEASDCKYSESSTDHRFLIEYHAKSIDA